MDGYHHQIGVNNWLGEGIPTREENSLGINQYEIIWESALDFIEMKEKLAQKNYPIELKSDNVFKIVDPNGIIVYMELKNKNISANLCSRHVTYLRLLEQEGLGNSMDGRSEAGRRNH